jgi:hypothetical protein
MNVACLRGVSGSRVNNRGECVSSLSVGIRSMPGRGLERPLEELIQHSIEILSDSRRSRSGKVLACIVNLF